MRGNVPATMKALVAYSAADYRFEQAFPVPECGPDDIIIKTEGCGICAAECPKKAISMVHEGGAHDGE